MLSQQWKFLVAFSLALLAPSAACLGQTEEQGDLRGDIEKLRQGFEQMKASYEARIKALERKVVEQEALRAKVDEKEEEIQGLKDKIAELEQEEDVEGLAERVEQLEEAEAPRHKAAPVGAYGGLMNPDISAIVNVKGFVGDDDESPHDEKVIVEEAEVGLQGYLWPGIRGDVFAALEQEVGEDRSVDTEIDLEEAYASFLDLPGNFQLQAGRKLQEFGRLNPLHPHHWAVPDTPLPLRRLFGDHPWFDDGLQVSTLIPNPWDAYFKIQGGVWNGRKLGHVHEHDDDGEHADEAAESTGFEGPVDWGGNVFTGRSSLDFPLGEDTNLMPGYSFGGGEGGQAFLHGADLTLIHRWPQSYNRFRWQNEFFFGDFELAGEHEHADEADDQQHLSAGERDADAWGGYSLLQFTLDKYWETGARFDWWDGDHLDGEWGTTAFLSYFFTHSMYVRPAYSFIDLPEGGDEHVGLVQLGWGLGGHAHRLED